VGPKDEVFPATAGASVLVLFPPRTVGASVSFPTIATGARVVLFPGNSEGTSVSFPEPATGTKVVPLVVLVGTGESVGIINDGARTCEGTTVLDGAGEVGMVLLLFTLGATVVLLSILGAGAADGANVLFNKGNTVGDAVVPFPPVDTPDVGARVPFELLATGASVLSTAMGMAVGVASPPIAGALVLFPPVDGSKVDGTPKRVGVLVGVLAFVGSFTVVGTTMGVGTAATGTFATGIDGVVTIVGAEIGTVLLALDGTVAFKKMRTDMGAALGAMDGWDTALRSGGGSSCRSNMRS
jgi:hypothetical protein